MDLDFYLFSQINNLAGKWPVLDSLTIFFAQYLGPLMVIFLFILFAWNFKKNWIWFSGAIASGILSRFIITAIIHLFFYQPRPFVLCPVNVLFGHSPSASFPSGHASFYFALSAFVWIWLQRHQSISFKFNMGILLIVLSVLMGIARIFGGVHWPSDVLAGMAVGFLSAIFVFYVFNKFFVKEERQ